MSELRRVLVVAGWEWQAQAWIRDQPEEIRRVARYVTGRESVVANDHSTTRYVTVGEGTWHMRGHPFEALDEIKARGIARLDATPGGDS